jgi:hypothetical protein
MYIFKYQKVLARFEVRVFDEEPSSKLRVCMGAKEPGKSITRLAPLRPPALTMSLFEQDKNGCGRAVQWGLTANIPYCVSSDTDVRFNINISLSNKSIAQFK